MTPQARLNAVLTRLAAATSVQRTRAYDAARDERNGVSQDERLEEVITKLEAAADELWNALQEPARTRRVTGLVTKLPT